MKFAIRLTNIVLICLLAGRLGAQSLLAPAAGTWRIHASYREARICEAAGDYIYAASAGGFFRVLIKTGEVKVLSKLDGFQSIGITTLKYVPALKTLIIGYSNGLIELLRNDEQISEITGFYTKLLQGDKSILHISVVDKRAIVSTNFGLLEVDLEKEEIKDSYTAIGPGGTAIPVLAAAVVGDSIYAGTGDGVIRARYSSTVNLNDFNNWRRCFTGKNCSRLCAFGDSLFFAADSLVYRYFRGNTRIVVDQKRNTARIQQYGSNLHIFRGGGIYSLTPAGTFTKTQVNILSDGCFADNGFFWFCTGIGPALLRIAENNQEFSYEPTGPSGTSVFAMTKSGSNLFTSAGGVSNTFGNAFNPTGFYIFTPSGWQSNPASTFNSGLYDYTFVHHNPVTDRNYVATHVNGMLEFRGTNAINRWDAGNSPLKPTPVVNMVRVSGIASDAKGNIWVTNFGSPGAALHMMNRSGVWTSFNLTSTDVGNLVVDQNGYKWIQLIAGGILVYDDNKTPSNPADDRQVSITNRNGLITNDVLSLSCDSSGFVWIGTTQGLNVFTNPADVFENGSADRLIIRQNGVDGYLLGEESINDICVDGGNRKWFATNNGVFLVDANGQTVLANYRTDNSPLPDNRVLCIGQLDESGEVFFGTDKGIVSFRSDASAASDKFGKVRVFPNPVRPGYSGPITIDGLAKDSEVRIADAAGNLVYKTKANGGTATWNGFRLDGTRPNSGVYFVFAINADGQESEMARFIFIP